MPQGLCCPQNIAPQLLMMLVSCFIGESCCWPPFKLPVCACSDKLDSEAIVEFVRALCAIAQEELDPTHAPRVYGLTKIVEIAHFNMSRIRYGFITQP